MASGAVEEHAEVILMHVRAYLVVAGVLKSQGASQAVGGCNGEG
jgi:hypothetical protein